MITAIDGSDFTVRVIDFPDATVGGAVATNDDGTFSIYINSRRSWEAQRESFLHELRHILNDDFYNGKDIREVECERMG